MTLNKKSPEKPGRFKPPTLSDLSVAMDVLKDPILKDYGTKEGYARAADELLCLDDLIAFDETDDRVKCEAIWTLMATGSNAKARTVIHSSFVE